MRRRLIAAAGVVSLVGLFAVQPAGADDTAVETVVGTSGARTMLVPSAASVSADLAGTGVAVAATDVVVDETAALGADWGVTVQLCGADTNTTNVDTDPITTLNVVKDCAENYLEHESQTTNIGALNNAVDETDGTIDVVAIDGVLNPAPTRTANEGTLDAVIEMIDTANSEDPDTAYTATYSNPSVMAPQGENGALLNAMRSGIWPIFRPRWTMPGEGRGRVASTSEFGVGEPAFPGP